MNIADKALTSWGLPAKIKDGKTCYNASKNTAPIQHVLSITGLHLDSRWELLASLDPDRTGEKQELSKDKGWQTFL